MPLPPKKKKADLAILIGGPEKKRPEGEDDSGYGDMPEEDEDDFGGDSDLPDEEDPLAAEGEGSMDDSAGSDVDPEHAALAEQLGFSDPEQQKALVDLIKLVTSSDSSMGSKDSGALPPLPESTY